MTDRQERHNWLRLALMPHIGAETFLQLIRHFGTATAAWQADAEAVRQVLVRKAAQEAWANRRGEAEQAAEAAEKWSEQENCRLLLLCDEDFPAMLSEGITPPPMLFVRGNIELLHRPSVAIVGSRHATPQALRIARDLCKIPLFTFSLTAETQTQVFGYFPPPIPPNSTQIPP